MKMTICDRCSEPMIVKSKSSSLKDSIVSIQTALASIISGKDPELPKVTIGETEVDLCESCRKELQGWLKIKPIDFKAEKGGDQE